MHEGSQLFNSVECSSVTDEPSSPTYPHVLTFSLLPVVLSPSLSRPLTRNISHSPRCPSQLRTPCITSYSPLSLLASPSFCLTYIFLLYVLPFASSLPSSLNHFLTASHSSSLHIVHCLCSPGSSQPLLDSFLTSSQSSSYRHMLCLLTYYF